MNALAKTFLAVATAVAAVAPTFAPAAAAKAPPPALKVLHAFQGVPDGLHPHGRLVGNPKTALYGTTIAGGVASAACGDVGCGVVFMLTPRADGSSKRTILYRFKGGADGDRPEAGVILVGGELFGTTGLGGNHGRGTVFRLTPPATGKTWTKTILHHFAGGTDGRNPSDPLVRDKTSGALYGTTVNGGDTACDVFGCGTVYRLAPAAGGGWDYRVIHRFNGTELSGAFPLGGLLSVGGSLIGTTTGGGGGGDCVGGCGTVFRLDPPTSGDIWTENLLHAFLGGANGKVPISRPLLHANSLYGTTAEGGDVTRCAGAGCGTVFQLTPPSGPGPWTHTLLYNFRGGADGKGPTSGLVADASGSLYGTTVFGGRDEAACDANGCGTLFRLAPPATPAGAWTKTTPHRFRSAQDGRWPNRSPLLLDRKANTLFGLTSQGAGAADGGSAFRFRLPRR